MIIEKRIPKRTPAFLKAVLESEEFTQEVRVRDVSVNGALLDVVEPLCVSENVTLTCGKSRVSGIVAWFTDGRLGMKFSENLTGDTLVDSLKRRMKVSAPKKYQPIPGVAEIEPESEAD